MTGAQPALGGTPGMIGYGLAKAAVHQLVKSLASTNSGLPANAKAVGILPYVKSDSNPIMYNYAF